jgi:hypothetical protein
MSRFANIQKGKRARKPVDCPTPIDGWGEAGPQKLAIVVLPGDDDGDAHESARAYATRKGAHDPKPGDVHYDLGLMVHQLVRSCVDPDVPGSFAYFFTPDDVKPEANTREAFELRAALVLSSFDRESIAYLHQMQEVWQDECSPWGKHPNEQEIIDKLTELEQAVDPSLPFRMFRLATVGSLLLTTVKQRAVLLRDRLEPGLSYANGSPTPTTSHPAGEA